MNVFKICCFLVCAIVINAGYAIDPKEYERLENGEALREKEQAVKVLFEEAQRNQMTGPEWEAAKAKPRIDWNKLLAESEKNKAKNTKVEESTGSGTNAISDSQEVGGTDSKSGETVTTGNQQDQNVQKKKSKKDHSKHEDTKWQTVGPLGPEIRKEEGEVVAEPTPEPTPTPKKLTPEEEKYQKEKEEFLKKFKK